MSEKQTITRNCTNCIYSTPHIDGIDWVWCDTIDEDMEGNMCCNWWEGEDAE